MYKLIFAALSLLFITSCDRIEYSPNQKFDKNSPTDLNAKNLEKLQAANPSDDTLRFILTGDTQRAYDQAKALVNVANSYPKLDFVLLNGDISDFGLLREMKLVSQIYDGLKAPYITIIGNHDLIANGMAVYQRMFGNLNFSFTYKDTKFICHDTNSREYHFNKTVPNLNWIAQELQTDASVKGIIGVSHIPPHSVDFDQDLRLQYEKLIVENPKFILSLHSHENNYRVTYPLDGNTPVVVSNAVQNREFLYIEVLNGSLLKYESVTY